MSQEPDRRYVCKDRVGEAVRGGGWGGGVGEVVPPSKDVVRKSGRRAKPVPSKRKPRQPTAKCSARNRPATSAGGGVL